MEPLPEYYKQDLKIPEDVRPQFETFAKNQGKNRSFEFAPFNTMLELWFLSVCIGARNDQSSPHSELHKFIDGNIFQGTDSNGLHRKWMIPILEAIAIGTENDHEIINDPADVIRIANNFAAGGVGDALQMLEGENFPLANLHNNILSLFPASENQ